MYWSRKRRFHQQARGEGLHGLSDYGLGRGGQYYPHPYPHPHHHPRHSSTTSGGSTFEEVESLCLSRSSNDSFGQFRRYGQDNGAQMQGPSRLGRFLSRQSSTTSTSTSSGNLPDHLTPRSGSTSTSGSVYEDNMETLDPRQQFDLSDHALLDGIFKRVLDWNNAHAAMHMARGGGQPGVAGPGGMGGVVPGGGGYLPPPTVSQPPLSPPSAAGSVSPAGKQGRRLQDENKDQQRSPASDITHVKKRRDLIIPDEEEDLSFSHYRRKPELKGKSNRSSYNSSNGMSSFSSKQASSDSISVLSSMSSISQSQDLPSGYKEPVGASWKEQVNQAWRELYQQQGWRPPDPGGHPWREQMMQGVPAAPPRPMMLSAAMLSRGMSMESMNSFGMPSPPESYAFGNHYMQPPVQSHAESVLMNLGFGSTEGFLPERFMRDWYNKLARAQAQTAYPIPPVVRPQDPQNFYGSASNLHSVDHSRVRPPSRGSAFEDVASASDLHHRLHPMNRSATVTSSYDLPDIASALPNGGQQSRIDRLKEYIDAYAHNMNTSGEGRAMRMRQFATSRQKSLPSYLETLTEEDEAKSRQSSYNPHDRESRLQAFLREDSLSTTDKSESQATSSGRASNEQSLCGSESESLSGSDHSLGVRFVSRQPPIVSTVTQAAPVTSRTLTLKLPNSAALEPNTASVSPKEHDRKKTRSPKTTSSSRKETTGSPCRKTGERSSPGRGRKDDSTQPKHERTRRAHLLPYQYSSEVEPEDETKQRPKSPQRRSKSPSSAKENRSKSPSDGKENRSKSPRGGKENRSKSPSSAKENRSKSPSGRRSKSPKHSDHHRSRSPAADKENKSEKRSKSPHGAAPASPGKPRKTDKVNVHVTFDRLLVGEAHKESPQRRVNAPANSNNSGPQKIGCLRRALHEVSVDNSPPPRRQLQRDEHVKQSGHGVKCTGSDCGDINDKLQSDALRSNESLEVADIFQNPDGSSRSPSPRKKTLKQMGGQVEPAMVSIVLEDVDGNLVEKNNDDDDAQHQRRHCLQQHHLGDSGQQEEDHHDLLSIPSCSSSFSLSPIPQSPVTVIEVSLDNQQDSLDTEEGTCSSKDANEDEGEMCDRLVHLPDDVTDVVDSFTDVTDPDEFPSALDVDTARRLLCPSAVSDSQSDDKSVDDTLQLTREVCVEADDGRYTPILRFSARSPMTSSSSSPSIPPSAKLVTDTGIQADDGTLSPILWFNYESLISPGNENEHMEDGFYFVMDQQVQCENSSSLESSESVYESPDEGLVMQLADHYTQTSQMVRYEMSSQTDASYTAGRATVHSGVQTGPELLRTMATPYHVVHDFFPHPEERLTRSMHSCSRQSSFDSEFWEYMGMDPVGLGYRHATSPGFLHGYFGHSLSPTHEGRSQFLSPSPALEQRSPRSSPPYSADRSHLALSATRSQLLGSSVRSPSSPAAQSSDSVPPQIKPKVRSEEDKGVNTCISMTDEGRSPSPSAISEARWCFIKPMNVDVDQLVDNVKPPVHVSTLTFNVDDYRNSHSTVTNTDEQDRLLLQERLDALGQQDLLDAVSVGEGNLSTLNHSMNNKGPTHVEKLGSYSGVQQAIRVASCSHISSPDRQEVLPHTENTSLKEKDSQSFKNSQQMEGLLSVPESNAVSTPEEARQLVVTRLLLRGSPEPKHRATHSMNFPDTDNQGGPGVTVNNHWTNSHGDAQTLISPERGVKESSRGTDSETARGVKVRMSVERTRDTDEINTKDDAGTSCREDLKGRARSLFLLPNSENGLPTSEDEPTRQDTAHQSNENDLKTEARSLFLLSGAAGDESRIDSKMRNRGTTSDQAMAPSASMVSKSETCIPAEDDLQATRDIVPVEPTTDDPKQKARTYFLLPNTDVGTSDEESDRIASCTAGESTSEDLRQSARDAFLLPVSRQNKPAEETVKRHEVVVPRHETLKMKARSLFLLPGPHFGPVSIPEPEPREGSASFLWQDEDEVETDSDQATKGVSRQQSDVESKKAILFENFAEHAIEGVCDEPVQDSSPVETRGKSSKPATVNLDINGEHSRPHQGAMNFNREVNVADLDFIRQCRREDPNGFRERRETDMTAECVRPKAGTKSPGENEHTSPSVHQRAPSCEAFDSDPPESLSDTSSELSAIFAGSASAHHRFSISASKPSSLSHQSSNDSSNAPVPLATGVPDAPQAHRENPEVGVLESCRTIIERIESAPVKKQTSAEDAELAVRILSGEITTIPMKEAMAGAAPSQQTSETGPGRTAMAERQTFCVSDDAEAENKKDDVVPTTQQEVHTDTSVVDRSLSATWVAPRRVVSLEVECFDGDADPIAYFDGGRKWSAPISESRVLRLLTLGVSLPDLRRLRRQGFLFDSTSDTLDSFASSPALTTPENERVHEPEPADGDNDKHKPGEEENEVFTETPRVHTESDDKDEAAVVDSDTVEDAADIQLDSSKPAGGTNSDSINPAVDAQSNNAYSAVGALFDDVNMEMSRVERMQNPISSWNTEEETEAGEPEALSTIREDGDELLLENGELHVDDLQLRTSTDIQDPGNVPSEGSPSGEAEPLMCRSEDDKSSLDKMYEEAAGLLGSDTDSMVWETHETPAVSHRPRGRVALGQLAKSYRLHNVDKSDDNSEVQDAQRQECTQSTGSHLLLPVANSNPGRGGGRSERRLPAFVHESRDTDSPEGSFDNSFCGVQDSLQNKSLLHVEQRDLKSPVLFLTQNSEDSPKRLLSGDTDEDSEAQSSRRASSTENWSSPRRSSSPIRTRIFQNRNFGASSNPVGESTSSGVFSDYQASSKASTGSSSTCESTRQRRARLFQSRVYSKLLSVAAITKQPGSGESSSPTEDNEDSLDYEPTFSWNSSFSEDRLSSPPLRTRRGKRSLSRNSSIDSRRSLSRGSSMDTSDYRPSYSSSSSMEVSEVRATHAKASDGEPLLHRTVNTLQVPHADESLAPKRSLSSRRGTSSPTLSPRTQSPIPDACLSPQSLSPVADSLSPLAPSSARATPDIILSPVTRSPTFDPTVSPKSASPQEDVSVSSSNCPPVGNSPVSRWPGNGQSFFPDRASSPSSDVRDTSGADVLRHSPHSLFSLAAPPRSLSPSRDVTLRSRSPSPTVQCHLSPASPASPTDVTSSPARRSPAHHSPTFTPIVSAPDSPSPPDVTVSLDKSSSSTLHLSPLDFTDRLSPRVHTPDSLESCYTPDIDSAWWMGGRSGRGFFQSPLKRPPETQNQPQGDRSHSPQGREQSPEDSSERHLSVLEFEVQGRRSPQREQSPRPTPRSPRSELHGDPQGDQHPSVREASPHFSPRKHVNAEHNSSPRHLSSTASQSHISPREEIHCTSPDEKANVPTGSRPWSGHNLSVSSRDRSAGHRSPTLSTARVSPDLDRSTTEVYHIPPVATSPVQLRGSETPDAPRSPTRASDCVWTKSSPVSPRRLQSPLCSPTMSDVQTKDGALYPRQGHKNLSVSPPNGIQQSRSHRSVRELTRQFEERNSK